MLVPSVASPQQYVARSLYAHLQHTNENYVGKQDSFVQAVIVKTTDKGSSMHGQ